MTITKENAKLWLPLVQALCDGKELQVCLEGPNYSRWAGTNAISFNHGYEPQHYRIKPGPALRAWKPEECPLYFMVRHKQGARLFVACKQCGYDHARVWNQVGEGSVYGMHELFEQFTRVLEDGTEHPCGTLSDAEGGVRP